MLGEMKSFPLFRMQRTRNTRTPAVVLPSNACDCAAHDELLEREELAGARSLGERLAARPVPGKTAADP